MLGTRDKGSSDGHSNIIQSRFTLYTRDSDIPILKSYMKSLLLSLVDTATQKYSFRHLLVKSQRVPPRPSIVEGMQMGP